MSNSLLTISDITNESLMILENDLVLADKVNREYDDKFGVDGAKIGYTVNVRMPARFVGTAGPALNVEDFVENSRAVTLTNQFHVDTQFITSDLLLSMDQFSKRVLKPKIATIANKVDNDLANYMRWNTAASVGVAGTRPTTTSPFLSAGAILDVEAVPRDGDRSLVLDPFTQASMVGSLAGLFNPQAQLAEQYKKGQMAKETLGFNWYMDQNISSQVNKVLAGTPVYTTTGTSSALKTTGWADTGTLQTSGWSNSTAVANVGDVFTIGGVFMVNPQARQATGQLRYFVVMPAVGSPSAGSFVATTDVFGNVNGGTYTSSGSGTLQLTIAECVISAGQFQNVGDVFTIDKVFMVNPQARQATGQLRYFVVMPAVGAPSAGSFVATTDVFGNVNGGTYTSSGSGTLQLTIAECVISAGQFQNVSAAPANSAAITLYSTTAQTSPQSLAFHKNAFTLVSADLPLPGGVDMAARAAHKDVGFSMRVVRQYTINNDALPTRIDVLYGYAPLYRSYSCRVHG